LIQPAPAPAPALAPIH